MMLRLAELGAGLSRGWDGNHDVRSGNRGEDHPWQPDWPGDVSAAVDRPAALRALPA